MVRLALVFAALLGMATAPRAQAVILQLSNEYGADSLHAEGDARFAWLVDELTDGAVEVVVHTDASLGYRSAEHLVAVERGEIALADTYAGALGDIDPLFLVSSLPYVAPSAEEARRLYDATRGALAEGFAEHGQILLYASPWPTSGIWAQRPILGLRDLAGLRIRTFDRNGTEVFRRLGAVPVELSWADVPVAIERGEIDAVLTSTESGINGEFHQIFGHYSEIEGYAIPLNFVHMNRSVFETLGDARQAAILAAADETQSSNWAALASRTDADYAWLVAEGVEVHTPTDTDYIHALHEAGAGAVAAWLAVAGEEGARLLEAYRESSE